MPRVISPRTLNLPVPRAAVDGLRGRLQLDNNAPDTAPPAVMTAFGSLMSVIGALADGKADRVVIALEEETGAALTVDPARVAGARSVTVVRAYMPGSGWGSYPIDALTADSARRWLASSRGLAERTALVLMGYSPDDPKPAPAESET